MKTHDLEHRVMELARVFEAAPTQKRLQIAPELNRIARRLDARQHPVARKIRNMQAELEQDAFDDMFNNMPV
ncbi:hypothetical protein OS190_00270 [Sulfitobacter sp. F26204]|uniref:hypothetical protein n=1 Tax=Sulfitobacter sp. F26204 TaxID=2996014 RepID=UPI00225DFB10|nr:hypothetical protein [Sulfitobacter sp. F26204]MCX7557980.1 hypothetical protein [Sulfitobacter sp. F26204]